MPYIKTEHRPELDAVVEQLRVVLVNTYLDDESASTEGMLNYFITRALMTVYGQSSNTKYADINNAIGVLECCKLELYRQVAAPYENQKMHENGPVNLEDDGVTLNQVNVDTHSDPNMHMQMFTSNKKVEKEQDEMEIFLDADIFDPPMAAPISDPPTSPHEKPNAGTLYTPPTIKGRDDRT